MRRSMSQQRVLNNGKYRAPTAIYIQLRKCIAVYQREERRAIDMPGWKTLSGCKANRR